MQRYLQLAYLFHQCATGLFSRDGCIAKCTVRHPGVERPFFSFVRFALVMITPSSTNFSILGQSVAGACGDQQIHMLLLNTRPSLNSSNTQCVPVALSPQSYVAWAGFSDEGTPVVVDSDGYVRMLHPKYPGIWTVLCNTKQRVSLA